MALVTIDNERCKGCSLCVDVCPKKIFTLKRDELNSKGFHPAGITDMEKCNACGFCAVMCPDIAIKIEK